jgi:hypothetical protein
MAVGGLGGRSRRGRSRTGLCLRGAASHAAGRELAGPACRRCPAVGGGGRSGPGPGRVAERAGSQRARAERRRARDRLCPALGCVRVPNAAYGGARAVRLAPGAARAARQRLATGRGRTGRTYTVPWRDGARIGVVVLSASRGVRDPARVADRYAFLADRWLRTPLPASAWARVLTQIRPDGTVSKATALQAFSIVYGPLPGVPSPLACGQRSHRERRRRCGRCRTSGT